MRWLHCGHIREFAMIGQGRNPEGNIPCCVISKPNTASNVDEKKARSSTSICLRGSRGTLASVRDSNRPEFASSYQSNILSN
jgi:hypothetical protein